MRIKIVLTNAPIALRMGTINELSEKINSIVVPADSTNTEDLTNLYEKSMDFLGVKLILYYTLLACLLMFVANNIMR